MATFITVKRVYVLKNDKTKAKKTQSVTIAVASIATVRPSNRLGFPEHRSTITLTSGGSVDVADEYKALKRMIGA